MRLALAVIFVFLLVPFSNVFAQEVQVGVGLSSSVLSYNQDEIDESRLFWGGHARLRVMKYFAGEVSLQRREDNFLVRRGNIQLETWPLQFSAMVYPLAALPVSPYVLAGTGWYFLEATITGDLDLPYVTGEGTISHNENAFHVGVGVEAFVGNHFTVGGDVRKVFLTFDTEIITYEVDAYLVNVGATFYF